jgi:hypothetical protein
MFVAKILFRKITSYRPLIAKFPAKTFSNSLVVTFIKEVPKKFQCFLDNIVAKLFKNVNSWTRQRFIKLVICWNKLENFSQNKKISRKLKRCSRCIPMPW